METETKTEGEVDTTNNKGEGENGADTVSIPKAEYDKLNQTLGSLKREVKDLKKPKDDSEKETSKTNAKPDDNRLLDRVEKMALKTAGLSHQDDIELARNTAKKWNVDLEDVLEDVDFQTKLTRQQTARSNAEATSNIKGSAGTSQTKFTPEYWIAKGTPPSREDVPDRKARAKIVRALLASQKSSKKFYND